MRLLAIALLLGLAPAAVAAPIPFAFQASLTSGPLAGTTFTGTGAYDDALETGTGTEYLVLDSLNFTLLGTAFDRAGIRQGGQAILQNGTLANFTAAYFPEDPAAPVSDIAFGFGGPFVIGYLRQNTFGDGTYAFTPPAAIPAPPATLLLIPSFALLALRYAAMSADRRNPITSSTA